MASLGIPYFLWNHAEPAPLLNRILSRVRLDHITIPLITGPRGQFRHVFFPDQPYFDTLGGWHYHADESAYAAAGVQPTSAEWLTGDGPLEAVLDLARQQNMKFAFRLDVTEAPAILRQVSDALGQDAWRQTRFDHRACISQPRVRALLRAAVTDALCFHPVAIQLENIELDSHSFTADWGGFGTRFRIHPGISCMCFCDACRRIATAVGVDVELAAQLERERDARRHAVPPRSFRNPPEPIPPVLEAYADARIANLDCWLQELAAGFPQTRLLAASYLYPRSARPGRRNAAQLPSAMPEMWLQAHVESRRKDGRSWDPTTDHRPEEFESYAPAVAAAAFNLRIADLIVPAERFEFAAREFIKSGADWIEFDGVEEAHRDVLSWLHQIVTSIRETPGHNEQLTRRLQEESDRIHAKLRGKSPK